MEKNEILKSATEWLSENDKRSCFIVLTERGETENKLRSDRGMAGDSSDILAGLLDFMLNNARAFLVLKACVDECRKIMNGEDDGKQK